MPPSEEHLLYWANLGDNRIGPIIRELVEAIIDEGDTDKMRQVANRLKFLSGSLNSYRHQIETARKSSGILDVDNGE